MPPSDRFVDAAPAQVWSTLLDEGVYLTSQATFYRLLPQVHEDLDSQSSERGCKGTSPPRAGNNRPSRTTAQSSQERHGCGRLGATRQG